MPLAIKLPLVLLIVVLAIDVSSAQNIGRIRATDPNGLPITPERQAQLCGRQWHFVTLKETKRGEIEERAPVMPTIEFKCDGFYVNPDVTSGSWKVSDDGHIEISGTYKPDGRSPLLGSYSIYSVSDSMLVLGQRITSSGDWIKEFTFSIYLGQRKQFIWPEGYDTLKEGTKIRYHQNGSIAARENYKIIKTKVSAEWKFLHNLNPLKDLDSMLPRSVEVGEWVTWFPDGKLESRSFYNDSGKAVGNWVVFHSDGRVAKTHAHAPQNFEDTYEYRESSDFPLITRRSWQPGFVIGRKDSLLFDRISFFQFVRARSKIEEQLKLTNLSDRALNLSIDGLPEIALKQTHVTLAPHASSTVKLSFIVPAGVTEEKIRMNTAEWNFDLNFRSTGYDITSEDFDVSGVKKLSSTFFFHRISEEHTLEIISLGKQEQKFLPSSQQLIKIKLKPGQYLFVLSSPSWRKELHVNVSRP